MAPEYVVKRPTGVGVLSRGKDYSVKDLGTSQTGYTNLLKKELGVSLLAEAPQTRWTQIHELSHVRYSLWSPDRVARYILKTTGRKVDVACVLAAEDARINEIAHRRVPDAHVGFALADPSGAGLRCDLSGYVASHASPRVLADTIRLACDSRHVAAVDAWLGRLAGMSERELSVLRVTVPLALLIDDLQWGRRRGKDASESKPAPTPEKRGDDAGEPGEPRADVGPDEDDDDSADDGVGDEDTSDGADDDTSAGESEGDAGEDEPAAGDAGDTAADESESESGDEPTDGDDDESDDAAGDGADPEDTAALGEPDVAGGHACGAPLPDASRSGYMVPRWIIPEVLEPALTVPLRGGNAMVTTAETGTSLRWASLHRIATDGVVFRKVRRRPGALQRGTVLVDVSSSMAFTDADLDAIVAAMPYATVAVYSGQPMRNKAWVVVVARNGKRVRSMTWADGVMKGGGNTCDGPALLWLSRQAAPRLWVCDGVVTRDNDVYSPELAKQCAAIMESAGILQVVAEGLKATCVRRLKLGAAPAVPALLAAVRDLERGRVRPA